MRNYEKNAVIAKRTGLRNELNIEKGVGETQDFDEMKHSPRRSLTARAWRVE